MIDLSSVTCIHHTISRPLFLLDSTAEQSLWLLLTRSLGALIGAEVTAAKEEAVSCVLWGLNLTHGGVVEIGFTSGICV